jgi:hypothetical protein
VILLPNVSLFNTFAILYGRLEFAPVIGRPLGLLPPDMSAMGLDVQSREATLDVYTKLSSSGDPNDKLLALGELVRVMQEADSSFVSRCAAVTDYVFLDKLIRNGTSHNFEMSAEAR